MDGWFTRPTHVRYHFKSDDGQRTVPHTIVQVSSRESSVCHEKEGILHVVRSARARLLFVRLSVCQAISLAFSGVGDSIYSVSLALG